MDSPLRILHLEDNPADVELVQATLEAEGIPARLTRAETAEDFLAALRKGDVDLVLADYTLPAFDGISALMLAQRHAPGVPFIFVSGTLGEDVAIEALKLGATDYVLKTRLARLGPSVNRALRETRHELERKRAEEALARSERELRNLIGTIPAMAFVALSDGSNEFVSRQWVDFSGLSVKESAGAGWSSTLHPDDAPEHLRKWAAARASGEPFENEARHRDARGNYRWLLVRAVPLRDEHGNVVKFYGTAVDIEDRKRAEEAYAKTQAELAHVTRVMTMGELAASIAHEVNQPLSGVVINANTCLRWLAATPPNLQEATEAANRIVRDGKRAGDVIARIRALATKSGTTTERLNINESVREVIGLAGDELRRKGVKWATELADQLPDVMGDRVQLQQVLLNLMMNAVDAMSTVDSRPRDLVIKTREDEEGQAEVSVCDSGIGLNEENMEKIFTPFYSTKPTGMGMGLSISRSIVQNHGGRLWAEPNDGHGASFHFTLPRC
jgi:PAS domain S-box-containing protein